MARDCVGAWKDGNMQRTLAAVESHFGVSATNAQIMDAF